MTSACVMTATATRAASSAERIRWARSPGTRRSSRGSSGPRCDDPAVSCDPCGSWTNGRAQAPLGNVHGGYVPRPMRRRKTQ